MEKKRKDNRPRPRILRVEQLEGRSLLAVVPLGVPQDEEVPEYLTPQVLQVVQNTTTCNAEADHYSTLIKEPRFVPGTFTVRHQQLAATPTEIDAQTTYDSQADFSCDPGAIPPGNDGEEQQVVEGGIDLGGGYRMEMVVVPSPSAELMEITVGGTTYFAHRIAISVRVTDSHFPQIFVLTSDSYTRAAVASGQPNAPFQFGGSIGFGELDRTVLSTGEVRYLGQVNTIDVSIGADGLPRLQATYSGGTSVDFDFSDVRVDELTLIDIATFTDRELNAVVIGSNPTTSPTDLQPMDTKGDISHLLYTLENGEQVLKHVGSLPAQIAGVSRVTVFQVVRSTHNPLDTNLTLFFGRNTFEEGVGQYRFAEAEVELNASGLTAIPRGRASGYRRDPAVVTLRPGDILAGSINLPRTTPDGAMVVFRYSLDLLFAVAGKLTVAGTEYQVVFHTTRTDETPSDGGEAWNWFQELVLPIPNVGNSPTVLVEFEVLPGQAGQEPILDLDLVGILPLVAPDLQERAHVTLDGNPLDETGVNFGSTNLPGRRTVRLDIENQGFGPLGLGSTVAFTGPHAGDFRQENIPLGSSVAVGEAAPLDISFSPSDAGIRRATMTISTSDPLRRTIEIELAGEGVPGETRVIGNGLTIQSGDSTPSIDDGTHAGELIFGESHTLQLEISNVGQAPLLLGSTVSIAGEAAADFRQLVPLDTHLEPGERTPLQIQVIGSRLGERQVTLSLATSDPSAPAFSFSVGANIIVDPQFSWTNPENNLDVDNNDRVNILDASLTLNALIAGRDLSGQRSPNEAFYDVLKQHRVQLLGVLAIVNDIRQRHGSSEPSNQMAFAFPLPDELKKLTVTTPPTAGHIIADESKRRLDLPGDLQPHDLVFADIGKR